MLRKNNERGFTLIELLVVISIIGLLSSVVLTSLNSARARARDSVRAQNLTQIRNALIPYAANNNGTYPATDSTFTTGDWSAATKSALAPYLPNIPRDPILNQGSPGWQGYGFMTCDSVSPNNSCSWLNSPQTGQLCPGEMIVWAYNTETSNGVRQCPATYSRVMTVVVPR
jgi:general secretion pathway protein G